MDPGLALQDAQVRLRPQQLLPCTQPLPSGLQEQMPGTLTQSFYPWEFSLMLSWHPVQLFASLYPLLTEEDSEGVGETQKQEGEWLGWGLLKLYPDKISPLNWSSEYQMCVFSSL